MRGKQGFECAGWMGGACQVFLCVLQSNRDENKSWEWMRHRTCSSSGIKSVGGAVRACSGLHEHTLKSLNVQGHDMCDAGKTCVSKGDAWKRRECNWQGRWKARKWYVVSMSSWAVQGMQRKCERVHECVRWILLWLSCPDLWAYSMSPGEGVQTSHVHTMQHLHFSIGGCKLQRCQIQGCVCVCKCMHMHNFEGGVEAFESLSWDCWGFIDGFKKNQDLQCSSWGSPLLVLM